MVRKWKSSLLADYTLQPQVVCLGLRGRDPGYQSSLARLCPRDFCFHDRGPYISLKALKMHKPDINTKAYIQP